MLDQHFPSPTAPPADVFGPLEGGERVMWRGRAGVAEYAFDQAASLPRWTLPETTEVLVTDRRIVYAHVSDEEDLEITSGDLRWLWPQHLRLQPGARSTDRGAASTQIQLVCGGSDGSFPALVFAGGDLATVSDADKLANVLRLAIARFRVDNAEKLGLTTAQTRMLSRLLIGPEFSNYQGGEGQTVSLVGALLVSRPAPAVEPPPAAPPAPRPVEHISPATEGGTRVMMIRPGMEADAQRAWRAAQAEEATQQERPDLASRAAALAARVASMVTGGSTPEPPPAVGRLESEPTVERPQPPAGQRHPQWPVGVQYPQRHSAAHRPLHGEPTVERPSMGARLAGSLPATAGPEDSTADYFLLDELQSQPLDPARFEVPTTNLAERAERVRRSAARFAGNSARTKAARRPDRETGISTRDNRNG